MTRPRIHQQEANYILKLLTQEKQRILTNDQELARLDREVAELRQLLFVSAHEAINAGFGEKKKRLAELQQTKYSRHAELRVLEALTAKYSLIANGKGKGRYKGNAANAALLLTIYGSHTR